MLVFSKFFIKLTAVFFILSLANINSIKAQEKYNFKNDAFSGINGVVLDPTHQLQNPNPWDVNVTSTSIFFQNNYAYISKKSALGLINDTVTLANYSYGVTGENRANVLDFYNKSVYKYRLEAEVLGPSFAFHIPVNQKMLALGFFTRFRMMGESNNIDGTLNYHNFAENQLQNFNNIKPMKTTYADWIEYGFNAAYTIVDDAENQVQIGVNLKPIDAYNGGFINSKSTITGSVSTDSTVYLNNFNIDAAYAKAFNNNSTFNTIKPQGKGFGVDFGLTIIQNKYKRIGSDYEYVYDTKWNISLLDFGKISYNGFNYNYTGSGFDISNLTDLDFSNGAQSFLKSLSYKVYGDSTASLINNKFDIGLPTGISFSYSKSLTEHKFINMGITQRLPIFANSLKRANTVYVNYNYQKEWLAYGASFSMYNYITPQFGIYFRLGPLYFGSDDVLPIFIPQNKLHSFTMYAGIKLYPFWDTELKRHLRKKDCNCAK